jgi:DNA-directed RNA polymerase subunit M/transcription elongation factor TFIIS
MQKNMFETVEEIVLSPKPVNDVSQENFCPRCGSFLKVVGQRGLPLLSCSRCGYSKPLGENQVSKQNVHRGQPAEIAVVNKEEESALRTFPTVTATCPTCGNKLAETWTVAVGAETTTSSVTFFRCTKCGSTRRETG